MSERKTYTLEEVVQNVIDEQTRLKGSLEPDVILRRCLMYLKADVTGPEAERIATILQGMNLTPAGAWSTPR
jgi:hypothetical protein